VNVFTLTQYGKLLLTLARFNAELDFRERNQNFRIKRVNFTDGSFILTESNRRQPGDIIIEVQPISVMECAEICMEHECGAFNVKPIAADQPGEIICQIMSVYNGSSNVDDWYWKIYAPYVTSM